MKLFFRFFLVLGFFLAGCASMPRTQNIPVMDTEHRVYFIYRGWHTSILLDAALLAAQNPQLAHELKGQAYARIGWGDGDYFTGKNKSAVTAAKALIASGYSAIQLLTYDSDPFSEIPEDTVVQLAITQEGMNKLVAYLGNSIAINAQGEPIHLVAYGDSMGTFFQSRDHYSAFSNCNTWSGNALRAAGLPVANRLTAKGVFEQAKFISRWQAEHKSHEAKPIAH